MKWLTISVVFALGACGDPSPKAPDANNVNNLNNFNNPNNENNENNNNLQEVTLNAINGGLSSVYTLGTFVLEDDDGVINIVNPCLPRPAVEPIAFEFRPGQTVSSTWSGTVFDNECEESPAAAGTYYLSFCFSVEFSEDGSQECLSQEFEFGKESVAEIIVDFDANSIAEPTDIILTNDTNIEVAINRIDVGCQDHAWATVVEENGEAPLTEADTCGLCTCLEASENEGCFGPVCAGAACQAPYAELVPMGETRTKTFRGAYNRIYPEEGYICYQPTLPPTDLAIRVCAGTRIVGEEFNNSVADEICKIIPFQRGEETIEINATEILFED